jgi:hypothetical protein
LSSLDIALFLLYNALGKRNFRKLRANINKKGRENDNEEELLFRTGFSVHGDCGGRVFISQQEDGTAEPSGIVRETRLS